MFLNVCFIVFLMFLIVCFIVLAVFYVFFIVCFIVFSVCFYKADSNRDSSLHCNFSEVSLLLFFLLLVSEFFTVCFVVFLAFLIVCSTVSAALCVCFFVCFIVFSLFFIRQILTGTVRYVSVP